VGITVWVYVPLGTFEKQRASLQPCLRHGFRSRDGLPASELAGYFQKCLGHFAGEKVKTSTGYSLHQKRCIRIARD